MTATPATLRAVADLLASVPGIPEPFVAVTCGTVLISWHSVDAAPLHDRIVAAETVLALVGGEARPDARGDVGGEVHGWHGCTLRVTAFAARETAVAS